MTRTECVLRDVPRLQAERLSILSAIDQQDDPAAIAILLRRIDKIEEHFDGAGLDERGNPK